METDSIGNENTQHTRTTFTKWVKKTLKITEHGSIDLKVCFKDGLLLIKLLEALTSSGKIKNYFKHPEKKAQMIDNLTACFKFMESENIRVDIGELAIVRLYNYVHAKYK